MGVFSELLYWGMFWKRGVVCATFWVILGSDQVGAHGKHYFVVGVSVGLV